MGASVSRRVVQAFYQAFASRDPIRISEFLTDDVEWKLSGPVDLLPFCGHRRGKAAVIDYFERLVPLVYSVRHFEPTDLVIDGNRAATFIKLNAVQKETGRTITYYCAHIVTFRDDKVAALQAIADTYDAVEQLMGYRIDAYREPNPAGLTDMVEL